MLNRKIEHAESVSPGSINKPQGPLTRAIPIAAMVLLAILTSTGLINSVIAQHGTITGEVLEQETDETLPGANILITGTSSGTTTDIDGRFTLRRVPQGEHELLIRYMGFEQQTISVSVADGERVVLDPIRLAPAHVEGDEILVMAYQRGQSRALTRQRQSTNIRNVVSAEQLDRFADQTVEGALQRIAGMGHGGEANIRGVGAGMSRVSVDGQRMGSTGADRSVDLNTISADMVQELDVIKVITPDMPADALSGVINISTRRPIGGDRSVNIRAGGGFHPRYSDQAGPGYRMSVSYGDSPVSNYSYGINLSYQREPRAEESFSMAWTTRNLSEFGVMDLLSSMESQYQFGASDRYGVGGQFTFQPTDRSTYHFQGMFNYQDRGSNRHIVFTNPRVASYITPTQTGPIDHPDLGGTIGYRVRFGDDDIHQYTVQAGGRHLFDVFDLEYKIGWGHGRSTRNQYNANWTIGRPYVDFFVDIEDRFHPKLEIASHGPRVTYPGNDQIASTEFMDHTVTRHTDNEITSTIDFEAPFRIGKLKFGGSAVLSYQQGYEEAYMMRWDGRVGPADFPQQLNNSWNVMGRNGISYEIPYLVDGDRFIGTFNSRFPNLIKDEEEFGRSESTFFNGAERVYSSYAMTEIRFGKFVVLGGARIEHTLANYRAREALFSQNDLFLGSTPVEADVNYTNIFPNAQFILRITDFTNIRTAYSRSIGRPTFTQLSPFRVWNYNSRSIVYGNPALKPMLSNNFDFLIEHYFRNVGQISLGLFYKKLDNFVYSETRRVPEEGFFAFETPDNNPEAYSGWNRTTYLNGDEAEIYGIEFSWQQNLSFLPGFLSNLGTYVNYTYTYSEADIERETDAGEPVLVRLQDQRPHVLNAGLDYSVGGFSAQVSYQWSSPFVSDYAATRSWVPSIQLQERVYADNFTDGANDVSLTVRYRITDNFRIWLNGANLLNHRSVNYRYDRDFYPTNVLLSGTEITMGLQYSL